MVEAAVAGRDVEAVTVDLRDCTHITEHGLSVLLAARSALRAEVIDPVLMPGPAQV